MAKKHQSYYMVIPSNVWGAEITAKAMVLYGHISTLSNKDGYCHASNAWFENTMKSSQSTINRCFKELEDNDFIRRINIYEEGTNRIIQRQIFLTTAIVDTDYRGIVKNDYSPIVKNDLDNNTSNNNTSINIDDIKGKMFFKLVDMYPPNRIGNRQHGLKKFKQLDIEDAKLTLINLDRYLALAGGYVKSLQNYIDQECYTEAWLSAEERNKTQKTSISNNGTKRIANDF